jgi:hypothetical protein
VTSLFTNLHLVPTTQFQYDVGATRITGFNVGCDGTIAYHGKTTFYECQTVDSVSSPSSSHERLLTPSQSEANIYTIPSGTNCGEITLKVDGCYSSCPAPSPPAETYPTTSTAPTNSHTSSSPSTPPIPPKPQAHPTTAKSPPPSPQYSISTSHSPTPARPAPWSSSSRPIPTPNFQLQFLGIERCCVAVDGL